MKLDRIIDWVAPPLIVFGVIAVVVTVVITTTDCKTGDTTRRETYAAWIKYTGNPKQLTFEEWNSLRRNRLLPEQRKD
jgi:hypothetical protein